MPGEFQERRVLFTHIVQDADCANLSTSQPDNLASRTPELPLQRLNLLDRQVEALLKQIFENVHVHPQLADRDSPQRYHRTVNRRAAGTFSYARHKDSGKG